MPETKDVEQESTSMRHSTGVLSSVRARRAMPVVLSFLLTACAVGPDYHTPLFNVPAHWKAEGTDAVVVRSPVQPGAWWRQLGDPLLDELITDPSRLVRSKQTRGGSCEIWIGRGDVESARGTIVTHW